MSKWLYKPDTRGMTVVEVVVLVTLFSTLLLLFAPRVSSWLRPSQPVQECMALKDTLEKLIQKSASTGLPYIFVIDMDNNTAWGVQTANVPQFSNARPLNSSTAIENMYDSILHFGPDFKFLDVEYADTVKFENGLAPVRFVNGTNEHVLMHVLCGDQVFTLWMQPFIAQIYVFEDYLTFENVYYQKN